MNGITGASVPRLRFRLLDGPGHVARYPVTHLDGRYVRKLADYLLVRLKIGGEPVWELPNQVLCDSLDVGRPYLSQRITVQWWPRVTPYIWILEAIRRRIDWMGETGGSFVGRGLSVRCALKI